MRENKITAKTDFPPQGKAKKCWKLFFARVFSSKITKNSVSLVSDERKTLKTARRLCFFIENCQKRRFACKRRAKNAENSPSLVIFHRKLPKTAFRLQAMNEKTGKIVLRGIPKGRNSEKQCFGMPRRVVFCENEPSGSPEASKFWKISFRGIPKLEKSEKRVLGAPRKGKIRHF